MNLVSKITSTLFGYNAVKSTGKRSSPSSTIHTEDYELMSAERKRMISTTRDLSRNFTLVAWALNEHLDATSKFSFHSQTGIDELDDRLELLMGRWGDRRNCDVSKRHDLPALVRLHEANCVLDGDSTFVKIEGGRLQLVEGNRIGLPDSGTIPPEFAAKVSQHGLVLDKFNAATHFCVCDRVDRTLVFNSLVEAEYCIFDGYFLRPDSTRGVSPLSSAVNTCVDIAETCEAQLIKSKLHAFLGVAIYSDAVENAAGGFGDTLQPSSDNDGDGVADSAEQKYKFNLSPGLKLELEKGDKIDMLESSTPSTPFQQYIEMMQTSVLKSLRIPYTFWDTTKANYSASKMDLIKYAQAIQPRQEANRRTLMEISEWIIPMLVLRDDDIQEIMSQNSVSIDQLKYDWRAAGRSWIDEAAEVQATVQRISAGLSSRTREIKKRGESWREIFEELKGEQDTIDASNVPVITGQPGQNVQQAGTSPTSKPPSSTKPDATEATNDE